MLLVNISGDNFVAYFNDDNPGNPVGISSTISVEDDVTIVGITVTLNITHQRPSDLENGVWLIGPDGSSVELTNLNGANDVTLDFFDSSSFGPWKIEVYDNVKKKTGTLNSWSITVDY